MTMLLVEKLPEMASLSLSLYDPDSAELLLSKGERLSRDIIDELSNTGYKRVFASVDQTEVDKLRRENSFDSMSLISIKADTIMGSDLYDENGTFLVAGGTRLSATILSSLARRKVNMVMVRRKPDEEVVKRVKSIRDFIKSKNEAVALIAVEREEFSADETYNDPSMINARSMQKISKQMETSGMMEVKIDPAKSLSKAVKNNDPLTPRGEEVKVKFVDIYQSLLRRTEQLFERLGDCATVESRIILEMCDELVSALVSDRELLLCSMFIEHDSKDYLAKHSLNTSIIAINIATAHGFSPKMVVEVGYGSLLMDIGMLQIPANIRFKKEKLTLLEINELKRHTIYGMDKLQYIHHLPKTTPLVAYQSHERLDGSGYPHGKRTHAIHDYSKIVAVSDIYHAIIASRPYKDNPQLPYKAMEELLKMGSQGKIDRRFVRSLLAAVSLFPVASWVRLDTGEVARVLRSNEKDFTKPFIVILFNNEGRMQPPQRINLAQDGSRKIVAAVKMEQEHPMVGF